MSLTQPPLPEVDARIVVTFVPDEKGRNQRRYTWVGGSVVKVDREMVVEEMARRGLRAAHRLGPGSTIYVGPYTLKIAGLDWETDAYVCRREGRE